MSEPIGDLSNRMRDIFRLVVEAYLDRGQPVGSKMLAGSVSLSPASIRGVMQELEERGLLTHPHTSAGRMPTETGLRLFVDGIEGFEAISIHGHRVSSFLLALVNELRARTVTTIFTQEMPYLSAISKSRELPTSALFENIFLLKSREIFEKHYRQIAVMKLREHGYDASNRVLEISDAGLRLGGLISAIEKHH